MPHPSHHTPLRRTPLRCTPPSRCAVRDGTATGTAVPQLPVAATLPGIPLALDAPADLQPAGYLVSEKYDGVRALWDGRQLRFRTGLAVAAPQAFLRCLPPVPLDGELWLGRGWFDALAGLVHRPSATGGAWRGLRYMVFDMPWAEGGLAARHALLRALLHRHGEPAVQAVAQTTWPDRQALLRQLDAVVRGGGEGLVLRRADAPYATGRSAAMFKIQPRQNARGRRADAIATPGPACWSPWRALAAP